MKKTSWVNGLDSLRFFLALIVVLSHMPDPFAIALRGMSNPLLKGIGYLITPVFCGVGAVIAFFIISGFVIHYPNKDKEINFLSFLSRRWIRLCIPMLIIGCVAWHYNMFFKIPLWSLYCELIYYTLYPLLVRIKISWTAKFWVSFVISAIIILVFCQNDLRSLIHQKNELFSGSYWQLGIKLTWLVGLPCWLLGVVLAQNIDARTFSVSVRDIFRWRLIVLVVGGLIQVLRFKFYVSWVVSMNLFAFLLFIWIEREIVYYRNRNSVPLFEKLGQFSYSLYLTHELVIVVLLRFIHINIYTYFVFISLIVASSYIIYLIIEKPSHMLAQKIRTARSKAVASGQT